MSTRYRKEQSLEVDGRDYTIFPFDALDTAGDTADTLAARVLVQEHRLYPLVLRRFLDGTPGVLTL